MSGSAVWLGALCGWKRLSSVLALVVLLAAGCASGDDSPAAVDTSPPTGAAATPSSSLPTTTESVTSPPTTTALTTVPPTTAPPATIADELLRPLAQALPPLDGTGAFRLRIPRSPDWLAADDDFVYVKLDGGAVVRLDPVTADQLAQVELSRELCQGIGAGYGSVWACSGTDVARIDPATDTVTATIPVNKAATQGRLATGFDAVWVLVGDGSDLVPIDASANEAGAPIPLGVRGTDVAVDAEHVWVLSSVDGAVVRVDPRSMTVDGTISIVEPLSILAADGLWVGTASNIVRIDEESLTVAQHIDLPVRRNSAMAARGSNLFVRMSDPFLVHIDADDGTVIQGLTEDVGSSGDILVAFDAIWTTAYDDNALFRIPLD